jgi:monoterpene epsilon-lactone hydrolase
VKFLAAALLLSSPALFAQQAGTTAAQAANTDTSYIDADGTAHITRVIPVPSDLSPEAKKSLSRQVSDAPHPQALEERRHGTDLWQNHAGDVSAQLYPANRSESTIAGVPVRVVTPIAGMDPDRVLLNIHGGGFNSDSGSWTESIPIANLTKIKVVSVLYRLAPEHPFPAGLDDIVAVYKELLKTYKPAHIAVYGTSAGAILTGEVAVRLKQLGLPLPGALGIFSGNGDLSRYGDSLAMYALNGLSGHLDPPGPGPARTRPTSARPTPVIQSCRPSLPTFTACRPPFSSPAAATSCSAPPPSSTAPFCAPATTTLSSSSSKAFPTPSGTTPTFPNPKKPTPLWRIFSSGI